MSNSNEGLMADPYASSGGSGSLAAPPPLSSPSGDFAPTPAAAPAVADDLFLNVSTAPAATPDYLFEENYDENFRRGFGERLTYHVGGMYSIGACLPQRPKMHPIKPLLHQAAAAAAAHLHRSLITSLAHEPARSPRSCCRLRLRIVMGSDEGARRF